MARTTPAQKPRGFSNSRVFPVSDTKVSCFKDTLLHPEDSFKNYLNVSIWSM
jgi:hypothetical protein